MPKLEIEVSEDQLERLKIAAKPFGLEPPDLLHAVMAHLLGFQDEVSSLTIADVAVRSGSLKVEVRHDRAILLADLLRKLELPIIDKATRLAADLDKNQVYALREWQDAIEEELPEDYEAHLESARRSSEASHNWLDAKVIECAACQRKFGWQILSPFCSARRLQCTECPKQVEVSLYDPMLETLDLDLEQEAEDREIERLLAACPCGGSFRFETRRRCPYCAKPVEPRLDDIGDYFSRIVGYEPPDEGPEDLVIFESIWREDAPGAHSRDDGR